jgi:hypothetical protein
MPVNKKLFLCVLALPLSMCTAGTETDNPLVDFDASACKSGEALTLASTVMRSEPGLELDPEQYDGLHCFAWQVTASGSLQIDILNYSAGCGVEWEAGGAEIADDALSITARNAMCATAAGGRCIYDLTFELAGVDTSRPVELTFNEDDCTTVEPAAELTLPLDEASEGIVCREKTMLIGLQLVCGIQHTPPCSTGEGGLKCTAATCDDGLSCLTSADEDAYDICLEACETDEDCTLDVDSCQDGLCRLRETF